jgi:hypothetical protein
MGSTLSGLGGLMALFGVVSSVLYFLKYNLRILVWIDSWGPTAGWVIRGGLIALGLVLLIVGKSMGGSKAKAQTESD